MSLVDKATALYFNPESIGNDDGARCGICWKFNPELKGCIEVEGAISGERGVCGLYVHGTPMGNKVDVRLRKVGKSEAGYAEVGPTHCVSCEYMVTHKLYGQSRCGKVEGMIEGRGCCNLYEH